MSVEQAEPVEWCRCAPDECIARFQSPAPDDCRQAFLFTHPPASDERLREALEIALKETVKLPVPKFGAFFELHRAVTAALGTQEETDEDTHNQ